MERKPQPKRVSKNVSNGPPVYGNNARNKNNQPVRRNGQGQGDKKTFLNDRYPDGNGPDTNLI